MVAFDDPTWRSPLTGSTKTEILVMRRQHRVRVQRVNVVLLARYVLADEERRFLQAEQDELERREQEERDNAEPIRHRNT